MKHFKKSWFVYFFIFAAFPSCVKDYSNVQYVGSGSSPVLKLSSSNVKRGEPLLISTNESNTSAIIRWTVNPSTYTTIMPANNQAAAFFAFAGTYGITASYYSASDTTRAYDSSISQITVNDSIYTTPPAGPGLDTALLAGDQITLVPVSASDSGLVILIKTGRLYNCTPYLTAYGLGQGVASLDFDLKSAEVVEGNSDCMGAKNPAIAYLFINPLTPGSYSVTANFDHTDYQGSLTVTSTDYTFNWNYSAGIIISPLNIRKQ